MDSLTQIVLGAAVGEVVLGKKVGNRAMLWGAIGGTIPDLDVLSNFVLDDMGALAFHRAISHSFFFAFTAPFLFGWLVERFYKSGLYSNKTYRASAVLVWMATISLIFYGINAITASVSGDWNYGLIGISTLGISALAWYFWKNFYKATPDIAIVEIGWKNWAWLFFWAILTHPLLDSCTTYGTQLFQPFSDYRVAFNNISVADPLYTFPFLICLIGASYLTRNTAARKWVNWAGIAISSTYLLWSFYNKHHVNQVFERSFAERNIQYKRYMTSPTIFNNLLWQGVAEGEDVYYHGMYSLLDEEARLQEVNIFPKNHDLIAGHENDEDIKTLKWFSNNYYNISKEDDGTLYLNDLRFGVQNFTDTSFVFKFRLEEKDGIIIAHETREPPKDADSAFSDLWTRILGIESKKIAKIPKETPKLQAESEQ